MSAHDEFLDEIERFLSLSGMSPTKFGTAALGDPTFVFQLRKGRAPSIVTAERIRAFIKGYRRPEEPKATPTEPERQAS